MSPDSPPRPPAGPMNATQRRAAEMRAGAGKQAQLKREAAQRRAARADRAAGVDPERPTRTLPPS